MLALVLALIGLIPLLFGWLACYLVSRELAARNHLAQDVRVSLCFAHAMWGALVAFVVEFCSIFRHLEESWMLISWMLISSILFLIAFDFRRQRGASLRSCFVGVARRSAGALENWPWDIKLLMVITMILLLFLGLLGAVFPAATPDSMTYHLPRVLYWIDRHTVDHFPTENGRQLESGPWSAFVLTTIHLMSGTDQFDNALQWFSLVLCVVASGWIAKQLLFISTRTDKPDLSRSLRAQVMAMALVATLPVAVVQSVTTQNDLNTAWWVVCFTVMTMAWLSHPDKLSYSIGIGMSLGLGLLTKVTALFYVGPVMVTALLVSLRRSKSFRYFLRHAMIIVLSCLFLNTPQSIRNYMVYGSPVSSRFMKVIQCNKNITISGTLSTLIRNLALHTDSGIVAVTRAYNQLLESAHNLTRRSPSDPDSTYGRVAFQFQRDFSIKDDSAGNMYHLLLILLAGGILLRRMRQNGGVILYGAAVGLGFVFFCATIRWQPWHGRFHLPVFVLLMPLVAVALAAATPAWVQRLSLMVVFGYSLFCLDKNQSCPFLNSQFRQMPREQQMLLRRPYLYTPMVGAASHIVVARCSNVGIKMGWDGFEYPFWRILFNHGYHGRIGHAFCEEMSLTGFRRNFDHKLELSNPPHRDASGLVYCSSRAPDVLVTVTTRDTQSDASITKALPHRTDYGPIVLFWSANAYQRLTNELASSRISIDK
jgi:hypothetical protein